MMDTLHHSLTQALAPLAGRAHLVDATTRGTEEILLLLDVAAPAIGEGPHEIHLVLAYPEPLFWCEPTERKKPYPSTGFGGWLRTQLAGAALTAIDSGESGRILRLGFGGAGETVRLILDPLPNACRLLVTGKDDTITQRYPPPVHASAGGRGQPGSHYEEPRGEYREPWQRLLAGGETVARGEVVPAGVTGEAGERDRWWVCLPASTPPSGRESSAILSPVPPKDLPGAWRSWAPRGTAAGDDHSRPAPQAARALARLHIRLAREEATRRELLRVLRAEQKQLRRLHGRVARELDDTRQGPLLRRQAEALLASAGRIPRGSSEVTIEDPSAPGQHLTIQLDPARSFSESVNRLFRQAGRLERARQQREEKGANIALWLDRAADWRAAAEEAQPVPEEETAPIEAVLGRIERESAAMIPRLDRGLRQRMTRFREEAAAIGQGLHRPHEQRGYESRTTQARERTAAGAGASRGAGAGGGAGASGRRSGEGGRQGSSKADKAGAAGIHPRRFEIADGWIVLVGRSNQENDTLTHKLARPQDLWFHARGVAGSHVVLQRAGRKDNPSRNALEAAAAIAAYYSKARTSSLAPVIYTEKRYVRKPRKAPPGLAVCLREKVLMVPPGLPPDVQPDEDEP